MNSSKTELILFWSKRQLEKSTTKAININEKEIRSVKCIRYLGVFLDGNLNFKEHNYQQQQKKCRKAMDQTYSKVCNERSNGNSSLILTCLSYFSFGLLQCHFIWNSARRNKMQRIQNLCAKIGENMTRFYSPYRSNAEYHLKL